MTTIHDLHDGWMNDPAYREAYGSLRIATPVRKPYPHPLPGSYRAYISLLAHGRNDIALEEEIAFVQKRAGIKGIPGRKAALIRICEGGCPIR